MIEKENFTPVSDLGEFGLIEHLTKNIKIANPQTLCGIGDDAAVADYRGKKILITTDLLTEGIHFNLIYTPLKHLGYKAVAVNLSDICAMNGIPRQITLSLALSAKLSVEHLDEFYGGVELACKKYGIDLIGGDTSSSLTGFVISVTALGEATQDEIVYRSGAEVNDLICVTGDLGSAFMGLQLLEREKRIFNGDSSFKPDFAGHEYILERQLKPEPRVDIIKAFREMKIKPTAMIDISDGLSSEIIHICKSSLKGCRIYLEKIPVDKGTAEMAKEFNISPETAALNGGEDYELLFTITPNDYDKIRNLKYVSVIGHITEAADGMNLIDSGGKFIPVAAQGWNCFGNSVNNL